MDENEKMLIAGLEQISNDRLQQLTNHCSQLEEVMSNALCYRKNEASIPNQVTEIMERPTFAMDSMFTLTNTVSVVKHHIN